jgi:predicted nucleotidyltransferase component of viral defense system
MYLHSDDRELFRDVILLTAERMGTTTDIVEKDYYVTMILRILAEAKYNVVFKGGTSLSKAFGVIDRFSEDIDITFAEHLGESRRKRLKYEILKPIEGTLGMEIRNWNSIESDKDYNHYDYYYESVYENSMGGLMPYIKLETALMSYAFPTVEHTIGNYIYTALGEEEPEMIEKYGLTPFSMSVQAIERTMIDKIFALCDYYMLGKAHRNSRHLYDIYKLAPYVKKDDSFQKLVLEVRRHRMGMSEAVAPSAREEVDVEKVICEICDSDFYKQDYVDTTNRLISDAIAYDTVRDFYRQFTESLF